MSSYADHHGSIGVIPIAVPHGKNGERHGHFDGGYYNGGHDSYSVSPPESENAISSASGMASYSVPPSGDAMASYASSSQGDFNDGAGGISASASGVDLNDYMQERYADTFDPIPLDKCTATQAQTSGHLNAKHRELLELQKQAQARLARSRERFAEGVKDAREVREDLEWTQKKVNTLKNKAAKKHANEYQKARQRYPSPE